MIKGRSDISQLAVGWAVSVGILLLAALLLGAVGALLLIRAAHGGPSITAIPTLPSSPAAEHIEALASATALRRGIAWTIVCAVLLVAAVGTTWYGPERDNPALRITTPSGIICGSVVRLSGGVLVLKTKAGEISIPLSTATTIAAVTACE